METDHPELKCETCGSVYRGVDAIRGLMGMSAPSEWKRDTRGRIFRKYKCLCGSENLPIFAASKRKDHVIINYAPAGPWPQSSPRLYKPKKLTPKQIVFEDSGGHELRFTIDGRAVGHNSRIDESELKIALRIIKEGES